MDLIDQQNALVSIISKAKRNLSNLSEDKLQISSSHNTIQFCVVHKDGTRTYLQKDNKQILKVLAKKYYAEHVLKKALTMKTRIDHFFKFYNFKEVLDVFENMPEEIKELIYSYDVLVQKW